MPLPSLTEPSAFWSFELSPSLPHEQVADWHSAAHLINRGPDDTGDAYVDLGAEDPGFINFNDD